MKTDKLKLPYENLSDICIGDTGVLERNGFPASVHAPDISWNEVIELFKDNIGPAVLAVGGILAAFHHCTPPG